MFPTPTVNAGTAVVVITLICLALFAVIAAMIAVIWISERHHEDAYHWDDDDPD